MKKFVTYSVLWASIIVSFSQCSKIKKTDAEYEREAWIAGFADSIQYYKDRTEKITLTLDDLNQSIESQLQNFENIKNPRAVEGFYILKGWSNKIPMTSTGIYARINEKEQLELVATLAGTTFDQIEVDEKDVDYKSEVVPNDQALNFRHERFNTVYFEGGKADTIAEFIAYNAQHKVNLKFLEGKVKKSFQIPENEKDMIRQTWDLYYSQKEARKLQKELWIGSKKIETFRHIMDTHENEGKSK